MREVPVLVIILDRLLPAKSRLFIDFLVRQIGGLRAPQPARPAAAH